VKAFRSIAVVVALGAILLWLAQIDVITAWFGGQSPFLSRIILALIGVSAVIVVVASLNNDLLTKILGRLGRSSGGERGPEGGDGAVIHHSSGEADFDGLPGNVIPPSKDAERDLPYPHKRSTD
jgi:uncharacterized membrane protein YuzA (DUF378 family)